MTDEFVRPSRRRTDGDGHEAERAARRQIAQEAYRLFVDAGCDGSRRDQCWRQATALVIERAALGIDTEE